MKIVFLKNCFPYSNPKLYNFMYRLQNILISTPARSNRNVLIPLELSGEAGQTSTTTNIHFRAILCTVMYKFKGKPVLQFYSQLQNIPIIIYSY